jgi:YebC/PmpR family DNA-binding regulatory protein
MSGHSKWSQIKRQKGVADSQRGQMFTKLSREIIISVREGGTNPVANFRLRLAIQKARDHNMPMDNIDRAIKKGSGELGGGTLAELMFEGYGPSGVAIMADVLTDNRNRTLQEVRNAFVRHGGNLGESGSVSWQFETRGVITIEANGATADELALLAIDAGAEDVKVEQDYLEIYTTPQNLEDVRKVVEKVKPVVSAEVSRVAKTTMNLNEKDALSTLKLLDHLEELDDVQHVFSNADFSAAVLEKLRAQA